MSRIFIGYHRRSQAVASSLVQDLEAMGHTVWFDQDLAGGQSWWNRILAMIRDTDAFVFVLDPESLNSTACKREYEYAADLGKAIVPVLTADGVSVNLLPPALSQIQFVDYRSKDREAVLQLVRALMSLPAPPPLPDPLPAPPAVPLSYLGTLTEQIDQAVSLTYEAQSALVVDLRANLRDRETKADALTLLRRLRKRRELFASIADEIDELLRADVNKGRPLAAPEEQPIPERTLAVEPGRVVLLSATRLLAWLGPSAPPSLNARLQMAAFGAVVGWTVTSIGVLVWGHDFTRQHKAIYVPLVLGAIPWAVAGAIAEKQLLAIKLAAIFGVLFFLGHLVIFALPEEPFLSALLAGGGTGLIFGATIGNNLCWLKRTMV
jgi:TIR domain